MILLPMRRAIAAAALALSIAVTVLPAQEKENPAAPAIPALASTETARLLAMDGETARVTGTVESVGRSPSGHQFLNFRESDFMTVTFRTDLAKFTEGAPADLYEGKTVAVTGPLKIYKGVPEIVLNNPSLIELIEASEAVVPPPPPEPEKKEEPAPEPEPAAPAPETPVEKEKVAEKKPPVDWRLYFPSPADSPAKGEDSRQ